MWGPLLKKSYILHSQALARHQTMAKEKSFFSSKNGKIIYTHNFMITELLFLIQKVLQKL